LVYAVERTLLPANLIDQVQWSAPGVAETTDRRVVASPAQVKQLLAAVRSPGDRGAHADFSTMPGSGRPRRSPCGGHNCVLPEPGGGRPELAAGGRIARALEDGGV
jgi:hypothetical protein